MIDLIAALVGLLFTLFWVAIHLTGWLIVAVIVLSPVAFIVSRFTAPPD